MSIFRVNIIHERGSFHCIGSMGMQSPKNVGIPVFETVQEEIDSGWMNTESISEIENLEIPENLEN